MTTANKDFKVRNGLVVGGTGVFDGTVTVATPTSAAHAATKEYVDENAAGPNMTVGLNPPVSPSTGDFWYNSGDGVVYIYYDSFWVDSASGGQEMSLDGYATETYVNNAVANVNTDDIKISTIMGAY